MRIGIITFHRVVNAGGFMQAYCLQQHLRGLGHDVWIINHDTSNVLWQEVVSAFRRTKGWRRFANLLPILTYRRQQAAHFKLTRPIRKPAEHDWSQFDAIVFGSDELWNFRNFFYGLNPLFFGQGINGPRKVSYAPSFGDIPPTESLPAPVLEGLKGLDAISVRDENAQEVIRTHVGREAELVLDPTLIHDYSGVVSPKVGRANTLLIYATKTPPRHQEQLKEYARRHNLRLVSLGVAQWWCDEVLQDLPPFEVLGWFAKASHVYTNTFHGAIFATKAGANTCIHMAKGKVNKIASLARTLGMEDRIVQEDGDCIALLDRAPNHDLIRQRMQEAADKSRQFLATQLQPRVA